MIRYGKAVEVGIKLLEAAVQVGVGVQHELFRRGKPAPMALSEGLEKAASHLEDPGALMRAEGVLWVLPADSLENASESDFSAGRAPQDGSAQVVEEVAIKVDDAEDDFGWRRCGLHVPSG